MTNQTNEEEKSEEDKSDCIFDLVYSANGSARINGFSVGDARFFVGTELARLDKGIRADYVAPIPETSNHMAEGYAYQSGLNFANPIVKVPGSGRSFTLATQTEREQRVMKKFLYVKPLIKGARMVLVDDSIVRGTTTIRVNQELRKLGAREIHMRVASPPVVTPCDKLGVFNIAELIATGKTKEEISAMIWADTLEYLPMPQMCGVYESGRKLCKQCFERRHENEQCRC